MRVIWVKMGFRSDLSDLGDDDVAQFLVGLGVRDGVLERNTWATDILDDLTPGDGDTIVWKTRFSAFQQTELHEVLTTAGITHLVVTGCTTSVCVESTVRDAFSLDYHCVVLEECTAEPMGAELHEAPMLLFERNVGSVSSSSDFRNAVKR